MPLQACERELGVRQAMAAMGLRRASHWASWALPEIPLAALHAAAIALASFAFQFDLATHNDLSLLFLLIFLSGLSLAAIALVASVFIRTGALAAPASFALYVVAWVLQLVVAFGFPYAPGVPAGWVALFSLFPWTLLSKGLGDLAAATTGACVQCRQGRDGGWGWPGAAFWAHPGVQACSVIRRSGREGHPHSQMCRYPPGCTTRGWDYTVGYRQAAS